MTSLYDQSRFTTLQSTQIEGQGGKIDTAGNKEIVPSIYLPHFSLFIYSKSLY